MKTNGMQFRDDMAAAIRKGLKTQTRRLIEPQPVFSEHGCWYPGWTRNTAKRHYASEDHFRLGVVEDFCPWQVGDRIFVVTIKPIEFGNGKYGIGDNGCLYDIQDPTPKKRAPYINHNGYEEINLRFEGVQKNFRINRLVAEYFYGRPPTENSVCRHIDGNRRNNYASNLDWGTPAQNTADANSAGVWGGEDWHSSRLTAEEVKAIKASSEPQKNLAKRYKVSQPTISKIKTGKRWRDSHPKAPPRNFPVWEPRTWLEITEIRAQRIQDFSEEDAKAEGVQPRNCGVMDTLDGPEQLKSYRTGFVYLWESPYPGSWERNDWVWALSFKLIKAKGGGE